MSRMGDQIVERYPATVEIPVPDAGFDGRRAEMLDYAAQELDCVVLQSQRNGQDMLVYRFRDKVSVARFQERLERNVLAA